MKTTSNRTLLLASGSRYRRELLSRLGLAFTSAPPDIDERAREGEAPRDTALRLAGAKARAIAAGRAEGLVIGSDQVADAGGEALSKPGSHEAARAMLARLSGQRIEFHTALALVDVASGRIQLDCVTVASHFRALSAAEIEAYLLRERPYDCAGAVKSEALGVALFERIESDDPTALIGLPLIALCRMLRAEGLDPLLRAGT